jgi:hypothetical protein
MGAPAIIAILRWKEREVVDDFRAAGAISPSTAQSYNAIGVGDTLAVKRLHSRAVIRETSPGLYYLDEEVWAAVRRVRQRLALVMLIIVLTLFAVSLGLIKR